MKYKITDKQIEKVYEEMREVKNSVKDNQTEKFQDAVKFTLDGYTRALIKLGLPLSNEFSNDPDKNNGTYWIGQKVWLLEYDANAVGGKIIITCIIHSVSKETALCTDYSTNIVYFIFNHYIGYSVFNTEEEAMKSDWSAGLSKRDEWHDKHIKEFRKITNTDNN